MTNSAVLPESIQRQVAEAEALEQQLYGQPAPEGNTDPVEEVVPAEPVVVAPEPEVVKQPDPVVDPEEETFRRRYEVLNGKYAAEVPRLHAQLRETTEQLQRAFTEIENLRHEQTRKVEQPVQDNDAEVFGEDLVGAIDRRSEQKARSLVSQEMQQMVAYIKQLEAKLGNVGEQVAVSAQDRFYNNLGKLVPDYEAVNQDQGFLNWLGEVDPVYGVPRQAALDAAANAGDADRVAAVFNAYKMLTSKQVSQQQKQQVRQELERQTAPTSTRGSASQPTGAKVWTMAEYEAALDPRNLQKLGRQKAEELYEEAERAYAEGRIQYA